MKTISRYFVVFCALFLLGCVPSVSAQSKSTNKVIGPENVSFPSGSEAVHGVLYRPQGAGSFPAIVIIHEWWGLNDWVKQQAQMFAGENAFPIAFPTFCLEGDRGCHNSAFDQRARFKPLLNCRTSSVPA